MRPLAERDGSLARAAADDGAAWVARRSADGHSWHLPPEAAGDVPEGAQWERLQAAVRHAVEARARRAAMAAGPAEAKPGMAKEFSTAKDVKAARVAYVARLRSLGLNPADLATEPPSKRAEWKFWRGRMTEKVLDAVYASVWETRQGTPGRPKAAGKPQKSAEKNDRSAQFAAHFSSEI